MSIEGLLFQGEISLQRKIRVGHNLLHLTDNVRELGPLWATYFFHLKDAITYTLKTIHGTWHADQQIVSGFQMHHFKRLHAIAEKLKGNSNLAARKLYNRLVGQEKHTIEYEKIESKIFKLGGMTIRVFSVDEFDAMTSFLGHVPKVFSSKSFF